MPDASRAARGYFLLTHPNAKSARSDSSNARRKKTLSSPGAQTKGSCCKMLPQSCQVQARAGLGGDLYFVDYNGNKPQTQIQRVSVNQTHVLFE